MPSGLWNCIAIPYVPRKNALHFSVGSKKEKQPIASDWLRQIAEGNLPFFSLSARRSTNLLCKFVENRSETPMNFSFLFKKRERAYQNLFVLA
jgi:hypothetical protein